LFAYVGRYGRNVPYFEDWTLVPVLSGARPFNLSWLVEMTVAEHRFVLAKALLYPLWLAGGGDFRVSLYFTAAVLSATAFACIAVTRSLRGRAAFADAVFPLTLLSLGHGENTLFFVQVFFVVPVVLLTMLLLVIASGRWPGRLPLIALLCGGLVLMPANGGIGMLLVPPLAIWFACATWARWRAGTPDGRRDAALLGSTLGATLLLAALYFIGFAPQPSVRAVPRTWDNAAVTAIQVFSLALGAGGREGWTWLGPAVVIVFGITACALAVVGAKRPAERLRAAGLFVCLTGTCLLAVAVGYGRATIGPGAGLPARYALLMAPALICVVLTAVLYGGAFAGRFVQALIFAGACAMIFPNVALGLEYGRFRSALADAVLDDVRDGVPPAALAQRYWRKLYPDLRGLEEGFAMLRPSRGGTVSVS